MTLFVLFTVLMIERFFDWGHLRHWSWFSIYAAYLIKKINLPTPLFLMILILPIVFIISIINYILANILYGFIGLIFHLMILLYCLGPQNLWADAYTSLNALAKDKLDIATNKLKLTFNISSAQSLQAFHKVLLEQFFIACNVRVFAPCMFYLIFGVFGVMVYRLIRLLADDINQDYIPANIRLQAQIIIEVLDWLPVRVLTFLFALGGHFMQVFTSWCKLVIEGLQSNHKMLIECGFKALTDEIKEVIPEDGSSERSAINLFDRAMIIFLVMVALTILSF